ncbi:NUC189-domain-containing protein [Pholiota conissans]|uniref:NUC189-domain-containing protein n=1 Tax=Pholiota conissans TaxID=109636 RepID=A0A9P6CV34_9AGAR|nr:NUC189-domain-containing protein [Pholiota conissans]
MPSIKKSWTSGSKTSKGRPTSTSSLARVSASDSIPVLSSFSPDGTLFAFATLAVDKHRIRVYNTASSRAVAEHTIDSGRVSVLSWSTLVAESSDQETRSPSKKRKKTRSGAGSETAEMEKEVTALVIGLSNGSVSFFSPTRAKVVCTISHTTSTSGILAVASGLTKSHLWTSSADSSIRLWDIQKNTILRSWKNDDHIPSTSLSVRPSDNTEQIDLLVGHHNIRLLEITTPVIDSTQNKPKQAASFIGHASSIKTLLWSNFENTSTTFFSSAEADRFIYVWSTEAPSSNQKSIAAVSLDSDVRAFKLATFDSMKRSLITLSSAGKLSFIPIPSDLSNATGDKASTIPSLVPRSTLSTSRTSSQDSPVIDFVSVAGDSRSIRVVRLARGIRPVFDVIHYLDDTGNYIASPTLDEISQDSLEELPQLVVSKRYAEPTSLSVGSGLNHGQGNEDVDVDAINELDGALQVDLAEFSLGQRLTIIPEGGMNQESDSEGDQRVEETLRQAKSMKKQARAEVLLIPANSLARTLVQALHSSDSRLLEMCLAHSDPVLIRNTVRGLPSQLALPLITACVDRLGRGARAGNMKGGGGGTSSQRGSGLLLWLKTVLAVHTGHLLTIPDLVARLSGLHSALTNRLSLHDCLLSLSGRLDMVLSQVELRASTAPARVAVFGRKAGKTKQESVVTRYVEGDTDSADDDAKIDVQVEVDTDDEGSIEDIELGGESDESDEVDFSEGGNEGGSKFIDDEAEEEYSEEEDEDESE